MATSVAQAAAGNFYIDGLLAGTKWTGGFTYSFPRVAADYPAAYGTDELGTFGAVSSQQREATRAILSFDPFRDSACTRPIRAGPSSVDSTDNGTQ